MYEELKSYITEKYYESGSDTFASLVKDKMDYKKIEKESTSLWHACNYHNTAEKAENQTACGLQIWLFDYKTLHFAYKSGLSFTKLYFLNTKTASRITKWHLVLIFSYVRYVVGEYSTKNF